MQLNKFIAHAGICSRRAAEKLIREGQIFIDGEVVLEPGYRIQSSEVVTFKGQQIIPERSCYILFNKPRGCVTTVDDEQDRSTVLDFIRPKIKHRVYPVGRLDRPRAANRSSRPLPVSHSTTSRGHVRERHRARVR